MIIPEDALQAALRDPEPATAFALADWLEEDGRVDWGQLVRHCAELERLGPGAPDAPAERAAAEGCLARLRAAGADLGDFAALRRGLPEWVSINTDRPEFVESIERSFGQWPARGLRLRSGLLGPLFRSPVARRVVALDAGPCRAGGWPRAWLEAADAGLRPVELRWSDSNARDDDDRLIAESPLCGQVRRAAIDDVGGRPLGLIARLAESPHWQQLEELTLSEGSVWMARPIDPEGAAHLLARGFFPRLRALSLTEVRFATGAFAAMRPGAPLARLERLRLSLRNDSPDDYAALGRLLCGSPLRQLELRTTRMGEPSAWLALLPEWPAPTHLRSFRLEWEGMDARSLRRVEGWAGWAGLTELSLRGYRADEARQPWFRLTPPPGLASLELGPHQSDAACLAHLADALPPGRLRELDVAPPDADARAALARLLASPAAEGLLRLTCPEPVPTGLPPGLRVLNGRWAGGA